MNPFRPGLTFARDPMSIDPKSPHDPLLVGSNTANPSLGAPGQSFQELFCERVGCSRSEFEVKVFQKCLYRHAKPFASVLRLFRPDLFDADFKFIRFLAEATDLREANASALDLVRNALNSESILANLLFIRQN